MGRGGREGREEVKGPSCKIGVGGRGGTEGWEVLHSGRRQERRRRRRRGRRRRKKERS